ncbi:hypothetical protein GCM10010404_70410 [Nonomuraea africana]
MAEVRAGSTVSASSATDFPLRSLCLGALASTCPTGPVAAVRAMEPAVPALWAEPAAPAADISETAPQAAMRRVRVSCSERVMDMVCSKKSVRDSVDRAAEPLMASTIAGRPDSGQPPF